MPIPMNYRSTQTDGRYVHFGGSVVVGSELGHGVEINAHGSTGAANVPTIQACGDDADIGLTIQAKGTGAIIVGNSSNSVSIGGSTPIIAVTRSTFTIEFAAISSGQIVDLTMSTALTLAQDGDLVAIAGLATVPAVMTGYRLSTVVTSRVTITVANTTSTATSTGRFVGSITYVDLT